MIKFPTISPYTDDRRHLSTQNFLMEEDKKLILGTLPVFASPDALALAQTLLQEKDVEAEAQLAIKKIQEKLQKD